MSEAASRPLPWLRRMSGRDPSEAHRASTPLELLFELTFVVAVARAGIELRDALAQGHAGHALAGYAAVFFGVWWAWVNFTWFASAYDNDDVPYRLLTLLPMAGVLVFAAGIPAHLAGFFVLVAAELAMPAWAEFGGRPTPWHPGHIAERYGEFTIIVVGEVIAAIATAVQEAANHSRTSPSMLTAAAAGLLLVSRCGGRISSTPPPRKSASAGTPQSAGSAPRSPRPACSDRWNRWFPRYST